MPQHRHPVEIIVNKRKVTVLGHEVTGLEIKQAADVPATFKLYNAHGKEVANDHRVHVAHDQRFTAISGQDVS